MNESMKMAKMSMVEVEEAMGLNELVELTPEQIEEADKAFYTEMTEILQAPDDMTHREQVENFFGKEYADSIDDEGIEEDWNIMMETDNI